MSAQEQPSDDYVVVDMDAARVVVRDLRTREEAEIRAKSQAHMYAGELRVARLLYLDREAADD